MDDKISASPIAHFSAVPDQETDGIVLELRSAADPDSQLTRIFFHREQALQCVTLWMQAIHTLQKSDSQTPDAKH
jgi:hypothetical protein